MGQGSAHLEPYANSFEHPSHHSAGDRFYGRSSGGDAVVRHGRMAALFQAFSLLRMQLFTGTTIAQTSRCLCHFDDWRCINLEDHPYPASSLARLVSETHQRHLVVGCVRIHGYGAGGVLLSGHTPANTVPATGGTGTRIPPDNHRYHASTHSAPQLVGLAFSWRERTSV